MRIRRALLTCGVLASLLYVAIDVLAAVLYPEYHRFASQAISELMARGAPTERFVDPLFLAYDVLMIAFGVGIWWSAGQERRQRLVAGLVMGIAVLGVPGPLFFEMSVRGAGDVGSDVRHIALTGVLVLLILAAIAVGAFTRGRWFRLYSFATLLVLVVSGGLVGFESRHLAVGEPTPWLGITERINIGSYLLWMMVFAFALLRAEDANRQDLTLRGGRSRSSGARLADHAAEGRLT